MKEYNMDDAIDFIVKNFDIDRTTVERVLELEEEWMENVGIATPLEEMNKDELFSMDGKQRMAGQWKV